VIVSPIAYASKRIFVLGKVVNKGQVMLDRPLTILEAVAEAGGLETGLYQLNTVELADLPRSLLVRNGKRVPCDFEKLFNEGDMEQNHILAPDDYLFFPSSNTNEFHVFGSVQNPGTQALTPQATVVSSISIAGSFTRKAWQKRVLVIRGSLSKPETFVVNVDEVLAGRERDFRLEPRDIVFVADRPWARVEELLETAVSAFTQAAVASWTGANIGPLISRPILPQR
jgi:protein involved in polysaccharide export with SLBB domain